MMTSKNSPKKILSNETFAGYCEGNDDIHDRDKNPLRAQHCYPTAALQCMPWLALLLKSYELTHCSVCGRNNKPKLSWLDISSPALCLLESCSKLHLRHKMLQKCCQWSELVVTDSERAYWSDSLWLEWCTEVTLAIQDTFEDDDHGDHDDKDNDREKKHSERKNSRAWCHDLWDVWSEWTLRITSLTFIVTPQLNGQHS